MAQVPSSRRRSRTKNSRSQPSTDRSIAPSTQFVNHLQSHQSHIHSKNQQRKSYSHLLPDSAKAKTNIQDSRGGYIQISYVDPQILREKLKVLLIVSFLYF